MGTETTAKTGAASPFERPLASLHGLMARPLTSYYLLLASSGLLLVIGLVMVFSATSVDSYAASGNPYASVTKQSIYALIGLAAFWVAHRMPLRIYKRIANPLVLLTFGALALLDGVVLLNKMNILSTSKFGPVQMDALRIYLGPVQIQPSEFAKLALALWAAGVLASLGPQQKSFTVLAKSVFPLAAVMLIMVGYNDLGTMLAMLIMFAGLIFAAGAQGRVFGYLGWCCCTATDPSG